MDDTAVRAVFSNEAPTYVTTLPSLNINIIEATEEPGQSLAQLELREIRRIQRQDPLVERWRKAVMDKQPLQGNLGRSEPTMKRQYPHLILKRGLLYRNTFNESTDEQREQLVLPKAFQVDVMKGLHDDIEHPGRDILERLLKEGTIGLGCAVMLNNGLQNVRDAYGESVLLITRLHLSILPRPILWS